MNCAKCSLPGQPVKLEYIKTITFQDTETDSYRCPECRGKFYFDRDTVPHEHAKPTAAEIIGKHFMQLR